MKTDGAKGPPGVSDLLEEKIGLLEEFLSITESIHQRLREKDTGEIGRLMVQRQNLIYSIDELDKQISQLSSEGHHKEKDISETLEDRLAFLSQTLASLFQKAADLNKKCLAEGESLREEIREELLVMRRGKKATTHYTERIGLLPRFMDVQE